GRAGHRYQSAAAAVGASGEVLRGAGYRDTVAVAHQAVVVAAGVPDFNPDRREGELLAGGCLEDGGRLSGRCGVIAIEERRRVRAIVGQAGIVTYVGDVDIAIGILSARGVQQGESPTVD